MFSAAFLIVAGAALIALLKGIGTYNRLVAGKNRVANAYSQVDVQLKRRHDLVPNLLETVKAYMAHERGTLEAVVSARAHALRASEIAAAKPGDAPALAAMGAAEGTLSTSLGRLFAVAESYPDLKSNQNMIQLSEELTSTENKVAFARQGFNDSVMQNNVAVESFPGVLLAGAFGFKRSELLQPISREAEREVPAVKF